MIFSRGYRITEANIQAECYARLKAIGVLTYLEYKIEKCKFDMVVLYPINENQKKFEIIAVVEFKSKIKFINTVNQGKQYLKYKEVCDRNNIPLIYCQSWKGLRATVEKVRSIYLKREKIGK